MATSLFLRVTLNAHPRSAWSPARPRSPLSRRTPAFADRDAQAHRVEAVPSLSSPFCVRSSVLSARRSFPPELTPLSLLSCRWRLALCCESPRNSAHTFGGQPYRVPVFQGGAYEAARARTSRRKVSTSAGVFRMLGAA